MTGIGPSRDAAGDLKATLERSDGSRVRSRGCGAAGTRIHTHMCSSEFNANRNSNPEDFPAHEAEVLVGFRDGSDVPPLT